MKLLLAIMLFFISSMAFAGDAYYTSPTHPGRHYDCTKPDTVVAYENDRVIYLCGGISEKITRRRGWLHGERVAWKVEDANKLLVKINSGESFTDEQLGHMAIAPLTDPFYDSSEKRMVHWQGAMLVADAATTVVGLNIGVCSEAGLFRHVPVLGLGIAAGGWYATRRLSMATPRYYSASSDGLAWLPVATHGIAAVHNLARCVF